MPKLSEVRPSPGKGLGTFALQDIKRGTRIICEKPLIQLSDNGPNVFQVFSELSKTDQAAYLSLYAQINGTSVATAFPGQEHLKLGAIADTNAFGTPTGPIITQQASRINHSCLPNAHHDWNDSIGAVTIHAARDISAGTYSRGFSSLL